MSHDQVRPGTENEEDLEETIQTCVLSDVRPGASPPPTIPSPPNSHAVVGAKVASKPHIRSAGSRLGPQSKDADPEASLITDYQLITDIRVY